MIRQYRKTRSNWEPRFRRILESHPPVKVLEQGLLYLFFLPSLDLGLKGNLPAASSILDLKWGILDVLGPFPIKV